MNSIIRIFFYSLITFTFSITPALAQPTKPFSQMTEAERNAFIKQMESRKQQYDALNAAQSKDFYSPEAMKLREEMTKGLLQRHSGSIPQAQDILTTFDGHDKYKNCIDGSLGQGVADTINGQLLKNASYFLKVNENAKKYCAAGQRDNAQAYVEKNTDVFLKNKFPNQFSTIKRCSEIPEYKAQQEHPCDTQ